MKMCMYRMMYTKVAVKGTLTNIPPSKEIEHRSAPEAPCGPFAITFPLHAPQAN